MDNSTTTSPVPSPPSMVFQHSSAVFGAAPKSAGRKGSSSRKGAAAAEPKPKKRILTAADLNEIEDKDLRKKLRNRQSALAARERKKARMLDLERKVAELERSYRLIEDENQFLRAQMENVIRQCEVLGVQITGLDQNQHPSNMFPIIDFKNPKFHTTASSNSDEGKQKPKSPTTTGGAEKPLKVKQEPSEASASGVGEEKSPCKRRKLGTSLFSITSNSLAFNFDSSKSSIANFGGGSKRTYRGSVSSSTASPSPPPTLLTPKLTSVQQQQANNSLPSIDVVLKSPPSPTIHQHHYGANGGQCSLYDASSGVSNELLSGSGGSNNSSWRDFNDHQHQTDLPILSSEMFDSFSDGDLFTGIDSPNSFFDTVNGTLDQLSAPGGANSSISANVVLLPDILAGSCYQRSSTTNDADGESLYLSGSDSGNGSDWMSSL